MINKDVWFLTQSLKTVFSFSMPLFQRNKNQAPKNSETACGTDLNGTIYDCDLRWKYEDTLKLTDTNQPLRRLKDSMTVIYSQQVPGRLWRPHKLPCAWAELCDNHNNLYWSSYWAFKESSMLFFHTQFTVLASVQAIMSSCPMCTQWLKRLWQSWKDYAMLCITGFCTELHTHWRLEMNMHY